MKAPNCHHYSQYYGKILPQTSSFYPLYGILQHRRIMIFNFSLWNKSKNESFLVTQHTHAQKKKKEQKANCEVGNTLTIAFQTLSLLVSSFPNYTSSSLLKTINSLHNGNMGNLLKHHSHDMFLSFQKCHASFGQGQFGQISLEAFSAMAVLLA